MLSELQTALNGALLGKKEVTKLAISCLLADGHLLLEDLPGMGKTTLSHALAHFTGMHYRRIQFTSDLLPSDLIGVSVFDKAKNSFVFHKGPLFSQLILADEINRATPKTQSALLEAMQEHQITTEEGTKLLPEPFFVIATQNPSYQTGTYPLPESQLDRFMMRLEIGYPSEEAELSLLRQNGVNGVVQDTPPVLSPGQLLKLQQDCQKVLVGDAILHYIQNFLRNSRYEGYFVHGLSPRAGLAIMRAAQAWAMINARDFVQPEDVMAILPSLVNHRLILREKAADKTPAELLLAQTEVPL